MPLEPTSDFLRRTLEALPIFEGRYTNLRLINYNPTTGLKRGCFSLVFRANDTLLGKLVALKFYDPAINHDLYRRTAFRREHEILRLLLNAKRCLQLTQPLAVYNLPIPIPGGADISLPCEYFGVEWLDDEVDDFFLSKSTVSPLEKLSLFKEILLSIRALHSQSVFHRDVKADNLRARLDASKRSVVAIDLGTAARYDSTATLQAYAHSVGAPAYAGPEAACGLAGNRKLAPFTDMYAAGCLLFELFNPDYFFVALQSMNPTYAHRIAAMASLLSGSTDQTIQLRDWDAALNRAGRGFNAPVIDGSGTECPPSIAGILNPLLHALTHIDYRHRPIQGDWAMQRILAATRTLENEVLAQKRVELSKLRRARRLEKIALQAKRLEDRLATVRCLQC